MALLLPLAIGARADDAPQRDPASDDIARLSALCQASPEDWEARLRLANAFLAAHRASEADAAYLKVLAARPSNATALLGRAQAAEARGRWVDASRLYRQAVEAGSGSDTRRAWLGLLHSLTRADPSRSSESARELRAAFETALALPDRLKYQ